MRYRMRTRQPKHSCQVCSPFPSLWLILMPIRTWYIISVREGIFRQILEQSELIWALFTLLTSSCAVARFLVLSCYQRGELCAAWKWLIVSNIVYLGFTLSKSNGNGPRRRLRFRNQGTYSATFQVQKEMAVSLCGDISLRFGASIPGSGLPESRSQKL